MKIQLLFISIITVLYLTTPLVAFTQDEETTDCRMMDFPEDKKKWMIGVWTGFRMPVYSRGLSNLIFATFKGNQSSISVQAARTWHPLGYNLRTGIGLVHNWLSGTRYTNDQKILQVLLNIYHIYPNLSFGYQFTLSKRISIPFALGGGLHIPFYERKILVDKMILHNKLRKDHDYFSTYLSLGLRIDQRWEIECTRVVTHYRFDSYIFGDRYPAFHSRIGLNYHWNVKSK